MAQAIRQSELFSGEDWTVLYRAFSQINFNAYDPPSINAALRSYIQTNYPEDFDDWIESSEFVAIIDLLSWLAGSLAFRTDVNARENFMETALARESVLRLARFLSYNPRRAQSARGMVKITEVKTTQSIIDSFGVNLNNQTIKWNDPDNIDWMEQFTLVLNAAFPATNPFGIPYKQGNLGGATTQLYRMNTTMNANCVYPFTASVDGSNALFELVNVDFDDNTGFNERAPDPNNGFHILYRNDGRGNASTRTGFFGFFKQGTLNQQQFTIQYPVENRLIDIDSNDVSETDVWVQSLDDNNDVTINWTKVPALFSENITFNDTVATIRDIFSVITRDNDAISLRFSDGRFGAVPVGNLKTWYRTVNGLQYQIRPRDMESISVIMPYVDYLGRQQDMTVTISLQETVNNALGAETIDQIKQRATQVYGTQNRMVSGEDYNIFPLSSNEVIKLRAVNRVYSGHSRYIDINDPTASFQDVNIFAQDGILYKDFNNTQYTQVALNTNLSPEQMVSRKIQPMLEQQGVINFFVDYGLENAEALHASFTQNAFVWKTTSSNGFNSKGYLDGSEDIDPQALCQGESDAGLPYNSSTNAADRATLQKFMLPDATLKFTWMDEGVEQTTWAKVVSTTLNLIVMSECEYGRAITDPTGPIIVDQSIPDGAILTLVIPPYRFKLDSRPMDRVDLGVVSEFDTLEEFISLKKPFKLWYKFDEQSALSFQTLLIAGQWHIQAPSDPAPGAFAVQVLSGSYNGDVFWSFETQVGTQYIFESNADVRWHDLKNHKVLDAVNSVDRRDAISVIWPKSDIEKVVFDIVDNVYDVDGLLDPRKVVVSPIDTDDDGFMDSPDSFSKVANIVYGSDEPLNYAPFQKDLNDLYESEFPRDDIPVLVSIPTIFKGTTIFVSGSTAEVDPIRGFYEWNEETSEYQLSTDDTLVVHRGKNQLRFQWQHYAGTNIRIDPAITNIIDVFVLTAEYDFLTRQWISNGTIAGDEPIAPSDVDLQNTFADFQQYKMFSDQLIWRPVQYKYLFGSSALPELQSQFKIVRLPNSSLSDGEIRSRVISIVNDFFDVNRWEFGETFFFTELAAYIHMQMASSISSVVIVPLSDTGRFGQLFEVRCNTNEMFISTAQVSDVVIIDGNSMANLRIS